jgi:predicted dehydrogenase
MRSWKVGVIGAGYMGNFHAQKFSEMPDTSLVFLADVNIARARLIAKPLKTHALSDYTHLYQITDAVSIASSTPSHFSIAKHFLSHSIDVMIEKPMTLTVEEADELIDIAEDKNLILQVGHIERFNPVMAYAKDRIKNPKLIEAHRLSPFKERTANGDVALDVMIHDVDLILEIVNSEISSVQTTGHKFLTNCMDLVNARIVFDNGCVASITASRMSSKEVRRLRIFQEGGSLTLDFMERTVEYWDKGKSFGVQALSKKPDILNDELQSFRESSISRKPPTVSGYDGRRALAVSQYILDQISLSNHAGHSQSPPESDNPKSFRVIRPLPNTLHRRGSKLRASQE